MRPRVWGGRGCCQVHALLIFLAATLLGVRITRRRFSEANSYSRKLENLFTLVPRAISMSRRSLPRRQSGGARGASALIAGGASSSAGGGGGGLGYASCGSPGFDGISTASVASDTISVRISMAEQPGAPHSPPPPPTTPSLPSGTPPSLHDGAPQAPHDGTPPPPSVPPPASPPPSPPPSSAEAEAPTTPTEGAGGAPTSHPPHVRVATAHPSSSGVGSLARISGIGSSPPAVSGGRSGGGGRGDSTSIRRSYDLSSAAARGEARPRRPWWAAWTYQPELALAYLIGLFGGVLAMSVHLRDLHPQIAVTADGRHVHQWAFVLSAGLLALFVVLCMYVWLRLQHYEWQLWEAKLAALAAHLVLFSVGATFHYITDQGMITVFATTLFLPPVLLFFAHALHTWRAGRYRLYSGARHRDRQLLLDVLVVLGCILGFALLNAASGHPQNGLVVSLLLLVVMTSFVGVHKYFVTFRFDVFCFFAALVSFALLLTLVLTYLLVIESRRQSLVFLAAAAYPTLLMFVTTLLVWRAHYWRFTRGVGLLLTLTMLLMLVLAALFLALINRIGGLVLCGTWLLLLLSGGISLLWSRLVRIAAFRRWASLIGVAVVLSALLAGAALHRGMVTFSCVCFVTIGSLVAYGAFYGPTEYSIRFGVLPVWEYDPSHGSTREAHSSTTAFGTALLLLLGWAAIAAYTEVLTLATLLSYLGAYVAYTVCLHAIHREQISVARLCDDLTPEMVAQGASAVRRQQHALLERRRHPPPAVAAYRAEHGLAPVDDAFVAACERMLQCLPERCKCDDAMLTDPGQPAQRELESVLARLVATAGDAQLGIVAELDKLKAQLSAPLAKTKEKKPPSSTPAAQSAPQSAPQSAGEHSMLLQLHELEGNRFRLLSFGSSLAAQLLLTLRMCADHARAEQDRALAGFFSGGAPSAAAARVATWSRAQLDFVRMAGAIPVLRSLPLGESDGLFRPSDASTLPSDTYRGSYRRTAQGSLWTDRSFGPANAILGALPEESDDAPPLQLGQPANLSADGAEVLWARAIEVVPPSRREFAELFRPTAQGDQQGALSPADVGIGSEHALAGEIAPAAASEDAVPAGTRLGGSGDGSQGSTFAIALRSVLTQPRAGERLRGMFSPSSLSSHGSYSVQLFNSGSRRWGAVQIDDLLPCHLVGDDDGEQSISLVPWHVRSTEHSELWPALLHKAVAKSAGSYEACARMSVVEVVVTLLGGLVQRVPPSLSAAAEPAAPGGAQSAGVARARVPRADLIHLWIRAGCVVLCEPHPPGTEGTSAALEAREAAPSASTASSPSGRWHVAIALDDDADADAEKEVLVLQGCGPSSSTAAAPTRRVRPSALLSEFAAVHVVRCGLEWQETVLQGSHANSSDELLPRASSTPSSLPLCSAHTSTAEALSENSSASQSWSFRYSGWSGIRSAIRLTAPLASFRRDRESARGGPTVHECKFQLKVPPMAPNATDGADDALGSAVGILIAVVCHRSNAASTTGAEPPSVVLLNQDSATRRTSVLAGQAQEDSTLTANLLSPPTVQGALSFADGPMVGPVATMDGAVLCVSLAGGAADSFTVVIHAPRRLHVSQFWSEEERAFALQHIVSAFRCAKARKLLKKLKRGEYRRRMALKEVLDMHSRFIRQLGVLANVWRSALRTLMRVDDDVSPEAAEQSNRPNKAPNEGASLINAIFPYLDSIHRMSQALHDALWACNRGRHALTSLHDASHPSYVAHLCAHLRGLHRQQWPASAVRLCLQMRPEAHGTAARELETRLCNELASALRLAPGCVRVSAATQDEGTPSRAAPMASPTSASPFPSNRQLTVRVELLAVAAASTNHGGPLLAEGRSDSSGGVDGAGVLDRQQGTLALHRRVEALVAAITHLAREHARWGCASSPRMSSASSASSGSVQNGAGSLALGGGITHISDALSRGSATCLIDASAGIMCEQTGTGGGWSPAVTIDASTPLGDLCAAGLIDANAPLSSLEPYVRGGGDTARAQSATPGSPARRAPAQLTSDDAAQWQAAAVSACMQAPDSTLGSLARALRPAGSTMAIGEAYDTYAEFFRVFSAWSNQMDSARNRIDACKKLDDFRRTLHRCQLDERTERADILNWLSRCALRSSGECPRLGERHLLPPLLSVRGSRPSHPYPSLWTVPTPAMLTDCARSALATRACVRVAARTSTSCASRSCCRIYSS